MGSFSRAPSRIRHIGRVAKAHATASYHVGDPEGLDQALIELGIDPDVRLPGDCFDVHNRKKAI
jgi:hypothetical protein